MTKSNKSKRFTCSVCKEKFNTKPEASAHIIANHFEKVVEQIKEENEEYLS